MKMYQQYINGKLVDGRGKPYEVVNPANGNIVDMVGAADVAQAEEALQAAQTAFKTWGKTSLKERLALFAKFKAACEEDRVLLTTLLANEVGKTNSQAAGEINGFFANLDYYQREVQQLTGEILPDYSNKAGNMYHYIEYRPVGVAVSFLAWNFPVQNISLKLAPAFLSGCTCVLRPSNKSPLTALHIGKICERVGIPAGVVNIISGPASSVGNYLSESTIPRLVSVIGSSEVGLEIIRRSSSSVKHLSMELGGNAPMIIMPDADLKEAADFGSSTKMSFSGQTCSNINRFFVHKDVHDKFVEMILENTKQYKVGWGENFNEKFGIGPVIDIKTRDNLLAMVEDAKSKGAKVLYGGCIPEGMDTGAYMMPTVIDGATNDMKMVQEEIFGPIISIQSFDDLDDALAKANDTNAGLASYVFTHDSRVIYKACETLEFGEVMVNKPVREKNLPHVGIKDSGLSCDNGKYALMPYYYMRRFSIRP
ncbi:MAG: aldehyde dehydrogenase family protein [bacterium]|nr:aldehyde dehydrogenase family protein [bacterium]